MKILYVIDKPLALYGAEKHFIDVILYQNKVNQVRGLILGDGVLYQELKALGIDVETMPWPKYVAKKSDLERLKKAILDYQPDIVHSHKPISALYSSKICRKLNVPHITTVHAIPSQAVQNKKGIKRVLTFLYHFRMQLLSDLRSHNSIFVSNATLRKNAIFKRKAIVIMNWVSPLFDENNKKKEPDGATRYLSISSLTAYKGVIELIEIFSAIHKLDPKSYLTIVGDSKEEYYKKQIADKILELGLEDFVSMEGYQDNPSKYYQKNDIFMFMSKAETFGLVLAEAMYYGLPVICSDIEVFREVVEPSNCFVDCNNPKLSDEVVKFLDEDNLKKVSLLNQKWAIERYDYEKQQEKITELYTKVLSNTL